MAIVRVKRKRNNFAQIDVTPLRDRRLSWKARGLMAFLMTKPDNWEINEENLIKESDIDGRDALRSGFRELKGLGYVLVIKGRGEEGKFIYQTLVFETIEDRTEWERENPSTESASYGLSVNGKTEDGKTNDGFSIDGLSNDGKPVGIYINEITNDRSTHDLGSDDRSAHDSEFLNCSETSPPETPIAQPIQPEPTPLPVNQVSDQGSLVPKNYDEEIISGDIADSLMVRSPYLDHPAMRLEARYNAGASLCPWAKDKTALKAFIAYMTNTQKRRGESEESSKIVAVRMIRKANHSAPGAIEYDRVNDSWQLFLENASKSVTPDQVIGKSKLSPRMAQFFAKRAAEKAQQEMSYEAV